jgi:hypothetical protein
MTHDPTKPSSNAHTESKFAKPIEAAPIPDRFWERTAQVVSLTYQCRRVAEHKNGNTLTITATGRQVHPCMDCLWDWLEENFGCDVTGVETKEETP